MIISRKTKIISIVVLITLLLVFVMDAVRKSEILSVISRSSPNLVMGGVRLPGEADDKKQDEYIQPDDQYIERFLRPSNAAPLNKKYNYNKNNEGLPQSFSAASEVVRAYYDILSDASDIGNKKGGCGTIGYEKLPYPVAYGLLSGSFQKSMPYEKFLKSFEGIGHINLIKFVEVPSIKSGETILPRFFVEIEAIEGSNVQGKTFFAYYYGYVSCFYDDNKGWKINEIEMYPQDFLCHAYHGLGHDASNIVESTYINKYKIIDKILGVEEDGYFRNVIAKDKDGKQYRFLFVRLTNGADIEIRRFVLSKGKWKELSEDDIKSMTDR